MIERAMSKITSYVLPESQTKASCWVAGITKPSVPWIGSLKPSISPGASCGAIKRQISGLRPTTKFPRQWWFAAHESPTEQRRIP